MKNIINIESTPDFTELWYNGKVIQKEKEYPFWIIYTISVIENLYTTVTLRWHWKKVPMDVRKMEAEIINQFKEKHNHE